MIQICFIIFSSRSTTCFGCCYHQNLCCSVRLQHSSVSLTQTYTLCKYTLGHNHTACACVCDCEVFLAFLFRLACQLSWHWSGWRWQARYASRLSRVSAPLIVTNLKSGAVLRFSSHLDSDRTGVLWSFMCVYVYTWYFQQICAQGGTKNLDLEFVVNADFPILLTANFVNTGNSVNKKSFWHIL